jgi:hypothetical protein
MTSRHLLRATVISTVLLRAAAAGAQPGDAGAQADALFKQAMELRSAGFQAAACPKFLASKELAPAVGVTLYLADCYERVGRTASAWREFREAERLARARGDKRADVAAQRAAALEPSLGRLTVAVPMAAPAGTAVTVDGAELLRGYWGAAVAVDPGDHVVTVAIPGQDAKNYVAHVDASNRSPVVDIGEPAAPPAPPTTAPVAPPAATAPVENAAAGHVVGRVGGVGLMIAGVAGLGLGTWLATDKVTEMVDGQLGAPHLRPGAVPDAVAAFSVGGIALISGAVLFYVNRPGRTEVAVAPTMLPGGGGAALSGSF